MLDYAALRVIFLIITLISAVVVALGSLPGKIATQVGHPWPGVVNAASWIALATGLHWPFALVWAFLPTPQRITKSSADADSSSGESLRWQDRVAALEATIDSQRSELRAERGVWPFTGK